MTHIDMSQSARSYFHARRYGPFPSRPDLTMAEAYVMCLDLFAWLNLKNN